MDRFAETITELNKELVTNSTKIFAHHGYGQCGDRRLRAAHRHRQRVVTDNFFSLLGKPEMQGEPLSVRRFEEVLKGIREKNPCDHTAEGDELLTIQQPDGVRYIMLRSTIEGHAKIGLAEDVTAAVLERKRIEHERDHDILTGLYNRQAFNRVCTELFAAPERMGVAALMMMDLDNLKHINDTYGHDWGDQYIRRTGQCLRDNTPAGTVCARLSGDEFLVLFHGYRSRDAVREKIDCLTKAMQQSVALLPSGNALHISLSGGIAWYPDDGQDWETLEKIRRLCHVSGQAFGEGPGGGVRHRGVQPRSLRRAHPQGVPVAAQQCAGVLLLPAHLLGAQRQGSRLRGADALRPAHPALPGHHHEAGAGAGRTVRDRAPHLYQGAGDLRQPVPGGQRVRGCHALCQLHRQHLPVA